MAHGDFNHIDIPVEDMGRATSFYSTAFGWAIAAPPGFDDYPMWRGPNQASGGGFGQRSGNLQVPRPYIEVDSIDATLAKITELGGKVVQEKMEITPTSWWAAFEDTEGNQLGLYEGTM